jgi:hypothetical protein
MKAGIRTAVALGAVLAIGALTAIPANAGSQDSDAVAKRGKCKLTLSEARGLGASYVTKLVVKNTSCGDGKKVTAAYHECRRDNGGADGRCKSKVRGFKCKEGRREGVPDVQYSAKVVCKKGSAKVVQNYTMNL